MSSQNLVGQQLGKYEIQKQVGRGSVAEVYKGYYPMLDRFVAIKVLHPSLSANIERRQRFIAEARLIAQLRHPNIVQLLDFDVDEERGMLYMVMDYVSGGNTLRSYVRELDGPIPVIEALDIIRDAAKALAYAHSKGVLHQNITPGNILLDKNTRNVLLTDFDIAGVVSGPEELTGTTYGTPGYLSPEQATGQDVDATTDVYSLGIVLYEVLTGRSPFDGVTPIERMLSMMKDPVKPPSTFRADIPPALDSLVLKALAKDRVERFASAGDLVNALNSVMASLDDEADGDGKKPYFFISYARVDWDEYVAPLVEQLEAAGIDIWVDQHLLQGGDDWLDAINDALDDTQGLILLVTSDALASKYVKIEYRYCFANDKPIYPVICKEVERLPAELFGIQHQPFIPDTIVDFLKNL